MPAPMIVQWFVQYITRLLALVIAAIALIVVPLPQCRPHCPREFALAVPLGIIPTYTDARILTVRVMPLSTQPRCPLVVPATSCIGIHT